MYSLHSRKCNSESDLRHQSKVEKTEKHRVSMQPTKTPSPSSVSESSSEKLSDCGDTRSVTSFASTISSISNGGCSTTTDDDDTLSTGTPTSPVSKTLQKSNVSTLGSS